MSRTNEQQKEYWKNHPDKYLKMKAQMKKRYHEKKIQEAFKCLTESSLNI